jgi:hypothetical protein
MSNGPLPQEFEGGGVHKNIDLSRNFSLQNAKESSKNIELISIPSECGNGLVSSTDEFRRLGNYRRRGGPASRSNVNASVLLPALLCIKG